MADLPTALRALNAAAYAALRAARNTPDAAGMVAVLRSIAHKTDDLVDDCAANVERKAQ